MSINYSGGPCPSKEKQNNIKQNGDGYYYSNLVRCPRVVIFNFFFGELYLWVNKIDKHRRMNCGIVLTPEKKNVGVLICFAFV